MSAMCCPAPAGAELAPGPPSGVAGDLGPPVRLATLCPAAIRTARRQPATSCLGLRLAILEPCCFAITSRTATRSWNGGLDEFATHEIASRPGGCRRRGRDRAAARRQLHARTAGVGVVRLLRRLRPPGVPDPLDRAADRHPAYPRGPSRRGALRAR